jgi:hypothetical protein
MRPQTGESEPIFLAKEKNHLHFLKKQQHPKPAIHLDMQPNAGWVIPSPRRCQPRSKAHGSHASRDLQPERKTSWQIQDSQMQELFTPNLKTKVALKKHNLHRCQAENTTPTM